jgi:hypothetical protein
VSVATNHLPLHITYPDAPFVEEFIDRYGTSCVELTNWALHCYRQRGTPAVPHWQDFCYLPVNAAVGYCREEWGMDVPEASLKAKYFATAQAFLASHLMIRLDANEVRDAWHHPCTGVIPFDNLMNVPAFCYYLDLSPIERQAYACGVFASWEDRFGMVETSGVTLHLIRGLRFRRPIAGERFFPLPLEIPLLQGKTVRDCIYKFLDDGLLNGADASSPENQEVVTRGLEFTIDQASRFVSLVSLVNCRLGDAEELPTFFEPLENRSGAIAIPECTRLKV